MKSAPSTCQELGGGAASFFAVGPEGQRSVLEWDLSLEAGQKAEVRMNYTLSWPDGYVLR